MRAGILKEVREETGQYGYSNVVNACGLWMELVHLVIDGFPHLDEGHYLGQLREYIRNRRALILKDADAAVGIMAFHEMTGSIDFLGVHPQYRKKGIAKAFCEKALKRKRRAWSMNETQAEGNPLSQDFTIKSLLKFAFPTIVVMLFMGVVHAC